jgi:cytochrome c553
MAALAVSVERGRHGFEVSCRSCHQLEGTAARILAFPRVTGERAESLEEFLEQHVAGAQTLIWDSAPMADLVAFLMSNLAGARFPSTPSSLEVAR